MSIRVDDINETRKKVTVSMEAAEVDLEQKRVVGRFAQQVPMPGFRPGKAPTNIILRKFGKDVEKELKRKIVSAAYDKVTEDGGLQVYAVVDLDAGEIRVGRAAEIAFTVDVEPDITLPEYKGITVTVPKVEVTEEEVETAIYTLRSQRAEFNKKVVAAEKSDYVQLSYEGRLEGQPLEEILPDEPLYTKQSSTWEEASTERADFPGLAKELVGLKAGDEKEITVDFPDNFPIGLLRGKSVQYAVKVTEVREKVLPELDEDFFKSIQIESAEELEASIRADIANRKEREVRRIKREQILNFLAENTAFDPPQSAVDDESELIFQTMTRDRRNAQVAEENPEAAEAGMREDAANEAKRRVKINRVIHKIAATEEIFAEQSDLNNLIYLEAVQTQQKPEKIAKELQKDRGRLHSMTESILINKTLDFLVEQSTVTET